MKKQSNDICFPLEVAKAQEKYLKENNITYPSDEKMLQAIEEWTLKANRDTDNSIIELLTKYDRIPFYKKTIIDNVKAITGCFSLSTIQSNNDTGGTLLSYTFASSYKNYVLKKWSQNKQVYRFDDDFINNLLSANEITICEDAWDNLPCQTFCLETPDQFFFVNVTKKPCDANFEAVRKLEENKNHYMGFNGIEKPRDYYFISCSIILKALKEKIDNIKNKKNRHFGEPILEYLALNNQIDYCVTTGFPSCHSVNNTTHTFKDEELEKGKYGFVLVSLINYLVSVKPDIELDKEQAKQYRKPNPNKPKSNIHEIQKWDVGVRYGNAIREYKKYESTKKESSNYIGTGGYKRPHFRKAHWSTYWYGKKDGSEKRIAKPVFLASILVNKDFKLDDGNDGLSIIEGDVVVHETK